MAWSSWRVMVSEAAPRSDRVPILYAQAVCAGFAEVLKQIWARWPRYCIGSVAVVRFRSQASRKPEGSCSHRALAELKRREIESGDSQPGELKDLVDHWVEVIDHWVEHLDLGMGGSAQTGADPDEAGQPPDPAPGPAAGVGTGGRLR